MLKQFRLWHTWLGVALGGVVIIIALTGIYMNHKPLFGGGPPAPADPSGFTTRGPAAPPFGAEQALAVAHRHWGNVALRSLELRNTPSGLGWKINAGEGRTLWLSAADGSPMPRDGRRGFDLGKLLSDLHSGEIGGLGGRLIADLTALVLVFLTLSGVWLWLKPWLIRRGKARAASRPPGPAGPDSTSA